jgi:predicted ATPase
MVHKEATTRSEVFTFKRVKGRGRRIRISGSNVDVREFGGNEKKSPPRALLQRDSLGLFTLPRLAPRQGGNEVRKVAELFSTFRVVDVNVAKARGPSPLTETRQVVLRPSAANLAAFLFKIREDEDAFDRLQEDARAIVPGLKQIHFRKVGGAEQEVVIMLEEEGLKGMTSLAEASFGTVRALSLLAVLYDPNPPLLTCIEEFDHGLHPYAFDRLVERLRWASKRTQFLIATHSPALVNRLNAEELIVCERDPETGESIIPAADPEKIKAMEQRAKGKLGLGELWFTGTLGGVPR